MPPDTTSDTKDRSPVCTPAAAPAATAVANSFAGKPPTKNAVTTTGTKKDN